MGWNRDRIHRVSKGSSLGLQHLEQSISWTCVHEQHRSSAPRSNFNIHIDIGPNAPVSCLSVDCVLRSCIPLSERHQISKTLVTIGLMIKGIVVQVVPHVAPQHSAILCAGWVPSDRSTTSSGVHMHVERLALCCRPMA